MSESSPGPRNVIPGVSELKENIPTERPAELTWNQSLHLLWISQDRYD